MLIICNVIRTNSFVLFSCEFFHNVFGALKFIFYVKIMTSSLSSIHEYTMKARCTFSLQSAIRTVPLATAQPRQQQQCHARSAFQDTTSMALHALVSV
jgi:hypothetical protein